MSEGQDEAPESAGMAEREAEGIMTEAETPRQIKEGNKGRKNKCQSHRRRGGGKRASSLCSLPDHSPRPAWRLNRFLAWPHVPSAAQKIKMITSSNEVLQDCSCITNIGATCADGSDGRLERPTLLSPAENMTAQQLAKEGSVYCRSSEVAFHF